MRRIEGDGEAAISRYRPGANHRAQRIFDSDGAARFAFTGQRQAICADFKLCRGIRCGGITRGHWRGRRDVACLVSQRDVEGLAVGLSLIEGDGKGTVSLYRPGANHCARCIFDSDRAADFTFTAQGQAINAHRKLCRCIRRGGVARDHWRDRRHVARLVGQRDVKGFAIFLRRIEGDGEAAISRYRPGANHRAQRIFDSDGAARFAFTGQRQAICADFKLCRGIRCGGIARNHWRNRRDVACLVSQRDVKGFAIGLSRVEGDGEGAVSLYRPETNHCARCVFNSDRAADFTFTAQGQAINAHRKLCRCIRRGGVARDHWRDRRHVARLVGQRDVKGFAIFLRRIEGDGEAAISRYRPGADHRARCVFHSHRAARLAFTGQRQTIRAHHQVRRGIRRRRVARHHTVRWRSQASGIGQSDA